jgi:hypothetical protein
MSVNYGVTWTRRTATAAFPNRTQADADSFKSTAMGVDLLYIANGIGVKPSNFDRLNDVWVSSNQGTSWQAVTLSAPYIGRQDGQLIALSTGALLVVAGDAGINLPGNVNDIWASVDGGYT